ncbi:MAG: energy transducer TonB [Ignavibacteriales bacterium]|nr:MAG: energy transducer TonB [Ignavibacteriales bacterium]
MMKIFLFIILLSAYSFCQTDSLYDEAIRCGGEYDTLAYPVGGLDSIYSRLVYPSMAIQNKIEGNVYVLAKIDSQGIVNDARIIKGIGYGCDEEAIHLIKTAVFMPALKKGKPSKVEMLIQIKFKIKEF